jgi:hypothetical protein
MKTHIEDNDLDDKVNFFRPWPAGIRSEKITLHSGQSHKQS